MGGAIALEFDPSHHHRLHGHQLGRSDISTALVDEFDLTRLFDKHPTVTPMSLYHILAHKFDIYCTTLILPSHENNSIHQSYRQRIGVIHAALQSKGLISFFPGFEDDNAAGKGAKDSHENGSAASSVHDTMLEGSMTSGKDSHGSSSSSKQKSEFHRVDDARCVLLFLTADYLSALAAHNPGALTSTVATSHTQHDAAASPALTAEDVSQHTFLGSDNGTVKSDIHLTAHNSHTSTQSSTVHPSSTNMAASPVYSDDDLQARDRCWREFLYIQRSLPATKIIPVIIDSAALHIIDWPIPLQKLYYPNLFYQSSANSSTGNSNTAEFYQHHPLVHLVQCQAPHDHQSSSSSSALSTNNAHSNSSDASSAVPHQPSFSLLRAPSHQNSSSNGHIDRLYDTVLHVIKIPLKPLIQEEMDRVLARSASLPSSVKLHNNDNSGISVNNNSAYNNDFSFMSTSSRNSSRPQSSSRRSFTLPLLPANSATHTGPATGRSDHSESPATSHLTSASAAELLQTTPRAPLVSSTSTPLVSSVIHFFVVEGHIAPAKAREYALIMAQQDQLESVPALKHHVQHQYPDYLQVRLGMNELEAKRMLQLLLRATGDVQEVRRRRSLGGGEISSTMMHTLSQQSTAAASENSNRQQQQHQRQPASDSEDDHTVHSARSSSKKRNVSNKNTSVTNTNNQNNTIVTNNNTLINSSTGSGRERAANTMQGRQTQRRRSDGGQYFVDTSAITQSTAGHHLDKNNSSNNNSDKQEGSPTGRRRSNSNGGSGSGNAGSGSVMQMVINKVSSMMNNSASSPSTSIIPPISPKSPHQKSFSPKNNGNADFVEAFSAPLDTPVASPTANSHSHSHESAGVTADYKLGHNDSADAK